MPEAVVIDGEGNALYLISWAFGEPMPNVRTTPGREAVVGRRRAVPVGDYQPGARFNIKKKVWEHPQQELHIVAPDGRHTGTRKVFDTSTVPDDLPRGYAYTADAPPASKGRRALRLADGWAFPSTAAIVREDTVVNLIAVHPEHLPETADELLYPLPLRSDATTPVRRGDVRDADTGEWSEPGVFLPPPPARGGRP